MIRQKLSGDKLFFVIAGMPEEKMKLQQIFFNPPKISVIDKNKYKKAKKELINNLKTNKFGFLSELNYPRINEINKIAKCLRKFEKVIFLGTGGSSLGGKTLISITENFYLSQLKPQIFFLENVDHISISQLIKKIKLRKTGIVIISKSETIETISQSIFLLNEFKKKRSLLKIIFL